MQIIHIRCGFEKAVSSLSSDDDESEDGNCHFFVETSPVSDGDENLLNRELDAVPDFFRIDKLFLDNDEVDEGGGDDKSCSFRREASLAEPILCKLFIFDAVRVLRFTDAGTCFDCRFGDAYDVVGDGFTAIFLVKPKGLVISRGLSLLKLLFDKHGFMDLLLPVLFFGTFRLFTSSSSEERDKS